MLKFEDLKVSSYEISLSKLVGKSIKDIRGFISDEDDPFFQLTKIVFADGTTVHCEGEHDCPYIYGEEQPNLDDKTLLAVLKSDPDYEE